MDVSDLRKHGRKDMVRRRKRRAYRNVAKTRCSKTYSELICYFYSINQKPSSPSSHLTKTGVASDTILSRAQILQRQSGWRKGSRRDYTKSDRSRIIRQLDANISPTGISRHLLFDDHRLGSWYAVQISGTLLAICMWVLAGVARSKTAWDYRSVIKARSLSSRRAEVTAT